MKPESKIPLVIFLAIHAAILGSGIAWASVRLKQMAEAKQLPIPQTEPVVIKPRFDDPELISDEDLARTLTKLSPRFRMNNPKINYVDHALRFWGTEAEFPYDPEALSGVEMRELLLDHRRFKQSWDEGTDPLLVQTEFGVRPALKRGHSTTSHVDHTLATLAEIGTPLDYPVITPYGESKVRDMLNHSLNAFSLNQKEYEWSALVYALYLPHVKSWYSPEGQLITFDRLAERILREKKLKGVCYGNHRLFTLIVLLRVNEDHNILSDGMQKRVIDHLKGVTKTFIQNQHAEGFWDSNWDGSTMSETSRSRTPISRRVLVTGHALEWWALAPQEILPPQEVRIRAAKWLVSEIDKMDDRDIEVNYTYLSHAGRALSLWRGKFPHQVSRSIRDEK